MRKQYSYKITSVIFSVLVVSFTIGFYVMAWTEPTIAPPDGNAELPVNVSVTGQTKTGPLGIGGRDSEFALTADIPGLQGIKVMDGSWFDGAVTSTVDFCLISGECLSTAGGSTLVEGDGISIVADTVSVDYSTGLGISTGQLINTGDLSATNEIQSVMATKGLQVDASDNFGLVNCSTDDYILKYDLGTGNWACAADESGAGVTAAFVNIANSGATTQFSASGADTLQFAGSGATAVSFDAANKRITFSSTDNYAPNTDTQNLSIVGHTISLVNGGNVTVPDNYSPNTDTQDLSIIGHTISLVNGGNVTVPDNYSPNTTVDGCTNCLNATEISDIYVFNSGDTMTGNLGMSWNNINQVHTVNGTNVYGTSLGEFGNLKVLYTAKFKIGTRGNILNHYYETANSSGVVLHTDSNYGYIWPWGTPTASNRVVVGGGATVDLQVSGNLYKGGGSFLIDHPLDPENKTLQHSFVESPEMLLIYKGRAKLSNKEVVVKLPDYFDALNQDENIEYGLTPINSLCRLGVKKEISDNKFVVFGDKDCEFSWVVYSVRDDAFAKNNPIIVEQDKKEGDSYDAKGKCIHPEACY